MNIRGISAELPRGGVVDVKDINPGFSLIYGPNEAGKSTLRKLITDSMFPPKPTRGRSNRTRELARGVLEVTVGEDVVVLRSPQSAPEGRPQAVSEVETLRNAMSRRVFESLFCLGLEEIYEYSLLDEEEITSRLSELSSVGSMARRLRDLEKKYDDTAKSLYGKSSNSRSEIGELRRQYRDANDRLQRAIRQIGSFDQARATLQNIEKLIVDLDQQRRQILVDRSDLDRYLTYRQGKDQGAEVEVVDPMYESLESLELGDLDIVEQACQRALRLSSEITTGERRTVELEGVVARAQRECVPEEVLEEARALEIRRVLPKAMDDLQAAQQRADDTVRRFTVQLQQSGLSQSEIEGVSEELDQLLVAQQIEEYHSDLVHLGDRRRDLSERHKALDLEVNSALSSLRRLEGRVSSSFPAAVERYFALRAERRNFANQTPKANLRPLSIASILLVLGAVVIAVGSVAESTARNTGLWVSLVAGGLLVIAGTAMVLRAIRGLRDDSVTVPGLDAPLGELDEQIGRCRDIFRSRARELGYPGNVEDDTWLLNQRDAIAREIREFEGLSEQVESQRVELERVRAELESCEDEIGEIRSRLEGVFVHYGAGGVLEELQPLTRFQSLRELLRLRIQREEAEAERVIAQDRADLVHLQLIPLVSAEGESSPQLLAEADLSVLAEYFHALLVHQGSLRDEIKRASGELDEIAEHLESAHADLREVDASLGRYLGGQFSKEFVHDYEAVISELRRIREIRAHYAGARMPLDRQRKSLEEMISPEVLQVWDLEDLPSIQLRRDALDRDAQVIQAKYDAALDQRSEAERRLSEIEGTSLTYLESLVSSLAEQIREKLTEFLVLEAAFNLIHQGRRRYELETRPMVLNRASELLSSFTLGAYHAIAISEQSGGSQFVVESTQGSPSQRIVGVNQLSRGTLYQLLLALRLAYVEVIVPSSNSYPVVLDDVCVDSDARRTTEIFRGLQALGGDRQIIYLTCHERERDLFLSLGSGMKKENSYFEIQRSP